MSTFLKLFILLIVIYSQLSLSHTNYVYNIINGTLVDTWRSNITIFADEFKGMVLLCIDSKNNQFSIKVEVTHGSKIEKVVKIKFNKQVREVTLSTFCACSSCDNTYISFQIRANGALIFISCNNQNSQSLVMNDKAYGNNHEGLDTSYPMPMVNNSLRHWMYFMIGNIGPYIINNTNAKNIPLREQMLGCVDSFYYNDRLLSLLSEGDKVKTSCSKRCKNTTCNGGLCRQISNDNFTCDCANVALNGPFCNNDMKTYNRWENHSYTLKREATEIYLKVTWQTLIQKTYCILEIIGESAGITNYLLLNSSFLSNNNKLTNFVIVKITMEYSFIKINNNESKIDFPFSKNTRINIGFSERNVSCVVFEGAHDIQYNSVIQPRVDIITTQRNTKSAAPQNNKGHTTTILGVVAIISIAIFTVIVIVLYHRNKKEMQSHIQQITTAMSQYSLDKTSHVFTETETYGKVRDSCSYDYIQDADDLYATVNV